MIPVTDEQVAAYKRLDAARLRLAELRRAELPTSAGLRQRAAWELAHDLAVREAVDARQVWDRLVQDAARAKP